MGGVSSTVRQLLLLVSCHRLARLLPKRRPMPSTAAVMRRRQACSELAAGRGRSAAPKKSTR